MLYSFRQLKFGALSPAQVGFHNIDLSTKEKKILSSTNLNVNAYNNNKIKFTETKNECLVYVAVVDPRDESPLLEKRFSSKIKKNFILVNCKFHFIASILKKTQWKKLYTCLKGTEFSNSYFNKIFAPFQRFSGSAIASWISKNISHKPRCVLESIKQQNHFRKQILLNGTNIAQSNSDFFCNKSKFKITIFDGY